MGFRTYVDDGTGLTCSLVGTGTTAGHVVVQRGAAHRTDHFSGANLLLAVDVGDSVRTNVTRQSG